MVSNSASTFHSLRVSAECPKSSSVSNANRQISQHPLLPRAAQLKAIPSRASLPAPPSPSRPPGRPLHLSSLSALEEEFGASPCNSKHAGPRNQRDHVTSSQDQNPTRLPKTTQPNESATPGRTTCSPPLPRGHAASTAART
eukprot:3505465-Prymnesium_polylepis.3